MIKCENSGTSTLSGGLITNKNSQKIILVRRQKDQVFNTIELEIKGGQLLEWMFKFRVIEN